MNRPHRIASPSGISIELNANGSIRRMDHGDIMLNLFPGNEAEGGLANIHLRRLGDQLETIPLLGPGSPASYDTNERGWFGCGKRGAIAFRLRLVLAESVPAWFWHVELENTGESAVTCDLIHTQDVGLAHYGAIRLNEYYVSQYVDHTPLEHPKRGCAVASRQNQSMGGRCPWTVIGSLGRGVAYATDALQVHGLLTRAGGKPVAFTAGLPGKRLQHEHSMVSIQDAPVVLAPGAKARSGFFGWYEADKPTATSADDAKRIEAALALPEAVPPAWPAEVAQAFQPAGSGDFPVPSGRSTGHECPVNPQTGMSALPGSWGSSRPAASLFTSAPLLESLSLDEAAVVNLFGEAFRHVERKDGELLSFFCGERSHVVLKTKELKAMRPHGHLLRSGGSLIPDESALTSTAWMNGVFHSMVTQGHVSINRFLSTCHTWLGLFRSHGQRVFVELDGRWHLLDAPSAYAMALDSCRWIYRHRGGLIEVVSSAPDDRHELQLSLFVREGPLARFLISHHVAINGDDGSQAIPVRRESHGKGIFIRAIPDCDVGRRFPEGGFLITPSGETKTEQTGGDELLFADGVSRNQPFLCIVTSPARSVGLVIEGRLVKSAAQGENAPTCFPCAGSETGAPVQGEPSQFRIAPWNPEPGSTGVSPACRIRAENRAGETPALPGMVQGKDFWNSIGAGLQIHAPRTSPLAAAAGRAAEIFPWFIHNALVHYLSPRGLEQYSGGGWGTRDVCQGPVELLLALGRFAPIRDLLCRVFRQQNADGDWPQWFMFFDRERNIRPGDSHGDIVYWPVLALAQYLSATGDAGLLDETLPFFHADGDQAAEKATVWQHVERALNLIQRRVIAGTRLAAYGHGDWNDSLQPAKPDMRERLCSSWTVTLNYQTLTALADALGRSGKADRAAELRAKAAGILEEFQRVLIVDDVLAGLAYFPEGGKTGLLLHPRDRLTGLSYSLLPMVHAIINDMLTPEQAKHHLGLIRKHLLGPDGAHLFDRPMAYHGGPQKYFQRAESASFFGREIGIMYTHAHLRYCEALARFGDAEGFFHALSQINPIGIREIVPSAALRQANCYYSSSDAAFSDRYEAFDHYDKVKRGEIALEGGWRVYSSGAGIGVRLILQCFLGLRQEKSALVVDPVMPVALDGLKARMQLAGRSVEVTYRIKRQGCGPVSLSLNGRDLQFIREKNPYRSGAVRISMEAIVTGLTGNADRLSVWLD
jgi:1,2-beta-oligoglucan phosphorylase